MAYEADSVVVSLIAENAQFDAATKASAQNFQQSMAGIQSTGAAAEKGVGQFSSALKANRLEMNQSRIGMMEFQHIARGVSDQIAAGAPATQILTQHLGMLGEAVALSGGAFGKFGEFLMGPWGIALTLATVVGGKLLASHLDGAAAADKHRTAEETLTAYVKGETVANDALLESLKKLNEQEEKSIEFKDIAIRKAVELTEQTLKQAQANRALLATQLGQAQADLAAAQKRQGGAVGPGETTMAGGQVALAQGNVDALKSSLATVDQVIGQALTNISTNTIKLARDLSTHVGRANDEFDKQQAALEARFAKLIKARPAQGDQLRSELSAAEEKLNASRAKAVDAAQKLDRAEDGLTKSTEAANRQFGKQISFTEAASIAKGAGLTVTSGYRSEAKQAELYRTVRTPENPVAKPGTSAHEGVNGKWALDIAFAPGLTPGKLRKIYGDQGVSLSAIYKESGHYHIEGSRSDAAAADKQVAAARQKAAEQQSTFTQEMDGLNTELLKARQSQVKDSLAQLDFQEDEVKAEQQKRDDSYASAVTTGKLTAAQAAQLTAAAAVVAAEKIKALETQRQIEIIKRQDDAAERAAQYRQDDLKAAEQAATSQAQRRELDLAILDILYDEKLAHLERLKLIAEGNKDQQAANDAQAQIDQLPNQKAADTAGVNRQTMDPLQSWLHSVPQDAQAVTEALQGIATNGFDQIASSIAGVVTGTETLGAAFKNIANQIIGDIVQMTIKMLIFRALSGLMQGGIPSPNIGAAQQVDLGLSSSLVPSSADFGFLPHFAGGGAFRVSGGDTNLLSINGQGRAFVKGDETIAVIPSNARAASPLAAAQSMVRLVVEASPYFDGRVAQVSGPIAVETAKGGAYAGAGMARDNLARRQLHQLGSRGWG